MFNAFSTSEVTTGKASRALIYFKRTDTAVTNVRLLCHTDGLGNGYQEGGQAHASLSADGWLAMWSSNQNNSTGRSDIFIAIMPRS